MSYRNYLVKEAVLPWIPDCPDMSVPAAWNDETRAQFGVWQKAKEEHQGIVIPDIGQIQEFACRSSRQFISGHENESFLYSPVGLWFCLHTLSNLMGGNSEAQIRHALGQQSGEARWAQPDAVFRSLYWEDDASVCIPAVSVWLNEGICVSEALLDCLAGTAHTSVFQGPMGEEAFDAAFQRWLNEQTRGLLKDSVSDLRLSPSAGLSTCSTIYLKSGWSIPFSKDRTAPDVFYADAGDVTTDFMHSSNMGVVFRGDGFMAAVLDFGDGGGVTFILPDAGISPEEILTGGDVFRFLFSEKEWDDGLFGRINLSVPKMDCLTGMSLRSALEKMGITDLFDPQKAQLSEKISSDSELSVSDLRQYARLILNEDGVEAAAITLTADGALPIQNADEIDFTLNRPFLYAVMSEKAIPLFIGTYHTP